MKRPTARASRVKKAGFEKIGVEENASQDEGVRTQHYSPTGKDNHQDEVEQIEEHEEHEKLNQKPKARANNKINKASQSPPKKNAGKSKGKAQGKDKEKGEGKRKRKDDAKEDTKTPPSKHTRTSPKSTGSGKKTFARRWQPTKDPSKTFWAALKDAFEQKVQNKVQAPSSLEDQSCSKTP